MPKHSPRKSAQRKRIAIPKDKLTDLAKSIESQKMFIQILNSDIRDPRRVQREVDRLNLIIAGYLEQLARYQERMENPQEMLNSAHDRLKQMQQEYKKLLHTREIEKMRELQAEIHRLQKSR